MPGMKEKEKRKIKIIKKTREKNRKYTCKTQGPSVTVPVLPKEAAAHIYQSWWGTPTTKGINSKGSSRTPDMF